MDPGHAFTGEAWLVDMPTDVPPSPRPRRVNPAGRFLIHEKT